MLIIQIFPQCDLCHETFPDTCYDNKRSVRRAMRLSGWQREKGYDICPDCVCDAEELLKESGNERVTRK